jgi:hypothetical protein
MGPLPQYCTPNHLLPIELGIGKKIKIILLLIRELSTYGSGIKHNLYIMKYVISPLEKLY